MSAWCWSCRGSPTAYRDVTDETSLEACRVPLVMWKGLTNNYTYILIRGQDLMPMHMHVMYSSITRRRQADRRKEAPTSMW